MTAAAMLTVDDVAARLNVHSAQVIKLIAAGELPALNVAVGTATRPRWRVDAAALERWIADRSRLDGSTYA